MSRNQKQKLANLKATNARRHLRNLEIEAYASAVNVFRAQGVLTKDKLDVLDNLGKHLDIPIERHYAELRRALSDYELNKTAETLTGFDPSSSWYEEAQKFADNYQPFIPKARFTTNAFRAISNYCTNQMLRDLLPCEENGKNITELNAGDTNEKSDHCYHNRIHPLAAKILAEWGADLEEPGALSRSYLTPVGLEELTEVFPDQSEIEDLENPPLSPSEDVTIENYMLTSGMRRGTEPKSLSTKRRRCTSEHKSQTDDTPSYEPRRSSDKNTPTNLSKIMQDYQLIMSLTKKKKVDQPEASTDRRRKGKKAESVTQESPIQVTETKNRSGLIVPCISIERMPLSQPKTRTPSPGKKISTSTIPAVIASPKKPNIKRMKKKQLSQTTCVPIPTESKSPLKRRRVRLKRISVVVSPNKVIDSQKETLGNSQTSSLNLTIQTQSVTESTQDIIEHTSHSPEPMEEVTELLTTDTKDIDNTQEHESEPPQTDRDNFESFVSDMPITSYGNNEEDKSASTQEVVLEATARSPEYMQTPEQTDTTLITEQIVSEQVLVRRKKDSNTSLDIPSPDKIRNEMQSLYSPISSLDTPPDLERAGHFELVPETAPSIHPNFSPITSPEESQSPDKQLHSLVIQPAERLSLVLQDPSIDVLPHKCSLALSDIVEEVCDSISDPLSPSLTYTRDESKPYTSPDSVFTDSSLMLSKALNSFMMSQGISEDNIEHRPAAQEHISDTTTELSDLISTQVLPAVEDLDFAQISASLLSIDQLTTEPTHQPPSDSTNS